MSTLIILGSTERTKCITTKEREDMEVDMSTQNMLHMNSGVGDKSYAHNSLFQRKAIIQAKPILEESITRLYYNNIFPKCFKVADLGCSSGPNALEVVSNIINIIVDTTSSNLNLSSPNFQFYLNDLFENDFNTIFKSLPQYHKTLLEEKKGLKIGSCFINATPGTFYNRLFPTSSIHFFHSSYCLHWLSQVPEKLIEGEEPLRWDNIYLTRTSPVSMHKAYLEQFQKDFKQFLKSRSEELVPGGGMLLAFIGRQDTSEIRTAWELIDMSLKDLLLEKLIEKATLECFNMPNYDPSMEEVKQVIEEEGSFILQKLETVHQDWDPNTNGGGNDNNKVDENMRGEIVAKYIRAITEPLLKAHFGELRMDELFLRLENKAVQLIKENKIFKFPILVISLIKNA